MKQSVLGRMALEELTIGFGDEFLLIFCYGECYE